MQGAVPAKACLRAWDSAASHIHQVWRMSSFVNTTHANKPLTCGNTVPEVGLEPGSQPRKHWEVPKTCRVRPNPAPVRPSPRSKVCTLCTPPFCPLCCSNKFQAGPPPRCPHSVPQEPCGPRTTRRSGHTSSVDHLPLAFMIPTTKHFMTGVPGPRRRQETAACVDRKPESVHAIRSRRPAGLGEATRGVRSSETLPIEL
jgi:hypothetical protein